MTLLFQILLLAVVVAVFTVGPYLVSTKLAIARGKSIQGMSGRNALGLTSEPRFYGLLSIFVAVLPAVLIALVGLGVYVPQQEKSVTEDVITKRLQTQIGENAFGFDPNITFQEFLDLPSDQLGFFGSTPQNQLNATLQVADDCVSQAAKVMANNWPLELAPPCLEDGFALNFFDGLGEARLIAEDRIINRTYLAIILAAIIGFICSSLVSVPRFRAREIQEKTTLVLLGSASLVAIAAMVALILTLLGNTLGFVRFGQTYDYGGPLRLPDWAQRAYANIDMSEVNRWSAKVEPSDFIDFDAANSIILNGHLVIEETIGIDDFGEEFVQSSREKWQVMLNDSPFNLGLTSDQLKFLESVKRRGGRLQEEDIRRLLPFASELIEPLLHNDDYERALEIAKTNLAAATNEARAKYQEFIKRQIDEKGLEGNANTLSGAYLNIYGHSNEIGSLNKELVLNEMEQRVSESDEAFARRKRARENLIDEEIARAQRKYAREQNRRAFVYFQDLSDSQRRWHWLRDFFSWDYKPGAANSAEEPSHRFGVLAIFYGTFAIGLISLIVAVPLGLLAAIYVSQFSSRRFRAIAKPTLEILAGIPTIVYGYFALLAVAPFVQSGFMFFEQHSVQWIRDIYNWLPLETPARRMALVAGMVMGFMLIPFISSTTEDALASVPKGMTDGALALGSTKSESLFRVQFFAALPGIVGGMLLAISRSIGETMIVFVAAGATPNAILTLNPLAQQTTATVIIANRFGGAEDSEGTGVVYLAFTIGFVLLMLTLVLNLAAIYVVRRFRARYE